MAIEIKVPTLGESVSEATIARWIKQAGDAVAADEPVAELETDKVTLEVPSPVAGVLASISEAEGNTVSVDTVIAMVEEGATAATAAASVAPATAKPAAAPKPASGPSPAVAKPANAALSPAVRRLIEENNLDPAQISGSGKDGRLTKADVLAVINAATAQTPALAAAPAATASVTATTPAAASPAQRQDQPHEERVPMSRLRQVIARRLKDAQNTAAMLTTFNEVDMSAVMALRSEYRDDFEKTHGVRLGFMGFFVKAVIEALRSYPAVNAEIDGTDIIYKNYYHIGVAVGTAQGLVVPVVRDADRLSLAETEKAINRFGEKARDGSLGMDDMTGGTFTISNGGVYGSLMSTPILNPPQSGILGMHKIQKRPVVVSGPDGDSMEIRPMMYLALSYDHRIIDGREAVSFLVRIKQQLEDPRRLLLGL